MFKKKKNKTQTSTTSTTVIQYEIKDGNASYTKSTKTTENGKVVEKSKTHGNMPITNLKDAVPMLSTTNRLPAIKPSSTYVSPYRNSSVTTSTTTTSRLPSTTKIWELPTTQTTKTIWESPTTQTTKTTWNPSTTTSLIKRWEAVPMSTIQSTIIVPQRTTTTVLPQRTTTVLPPRTIVSPPKQIVATKPKISQSSRTIPKSKLIPGNVYILNHMKFDNSKNEYRVGSDHDVAELKKTFAKFNMKVIVKADQNKSDIQRLMRNIERENFSKHACIVFVILTHGTRYEMISAKDELYSIDDDVLFPMVRNETLKGKPKIILVQACKGDREIEVYADSMKSAPSGNPDEILKFYSTFEGYLSYRTELGSYFIQSFCSNLQRDGQSKDIGEICEEVTRDVKKRSNHKQIPTITKNLTEKFVFGDYK